MRTELSKSSFRSLDFITVPLRSPPVKPDRYIDMISIYYFFQTLLADFSKMIRINEASQSNPCLELRQSGMKYVTHKTFFMLNKFEMCSKLKIQKPTMHFLTLWQASPQFLGVRANTVGRVSATTRRRLLSCMIGYFLSFLCFVFGTGARFTAQLSTLFTPG